MPIGPNGVPEFDTLKASPFSDPKIVAGMVSYDYTLEQQGLTSSVSCGFSSTNPFTNVSSLDPPNRLAIQYNISCENYGEFEVLSGVPSFYSTLGNNTLLYWACQSASNGMSMDSYSIYLGGFSLGLPNGYSAKIGYITCSVKPLQTAILPVRYDSTTNIFSAAQTTPESSQVITFPNLLTYALVGLGEVVVEGQNYEANLVAESVLTFAYKSFNVSVNATQPTEFLRLFERMIQGILEYEVCPIEMLSRHPSYCHPSGLLSAIDILDDRQSP